MEEKTIFYVHSYRCKHASQEQEEEYIKKAIELGATKIVFTDHAPFPGNPFLNRMSIKELPDYVTVLQGLKEKYAGILEIKIGLEIEFVPTYREYYQALLDKWDMDILLLGEHFSLLPDGRYTFDIDVPKALAYHQLIESIPEAIETGLFSAVAHPERDFHEDDRWTEKDTEIKNAIFAAALQHHVKMEKNAALLESGGKHQQFWQDIPEQIMMVYGVDAHCPEDIGRRIQLLKTAANE